MEFLRFTPLLLLAIFFTSVSADSIHGCGGFFEASSALIRSRKQANSKLDYSHITVELCTVDGLIKERTQCAPNGYYFIPVYDKGSFIIKIKGPDGWTWQPDQVPVTIDNSGCNGNSDINFQFTGFTLSGRILGAVGGESCVQKNAGPSNVKVDLLSLQDEILASAITSPSGIYAFMNVIPGKYKVKASHPNLNVEVRGLTEVNLEFGNGKIDDIFFVSGYDIYGLVVAQGNPILGVHLYLLSDDVMEVNCPQGSGNSPFPRHALCHATTDANGKFTFSSVPCGTYDLLPYYKGENTVFDVSPPKLTISVEHNHYTVPQKFQVTGFSVGGRVLDGNGDGVENVKIFLDGVEKTITDIQGYYKLDQVTSQHYKITAEKEHYRFNSLDNFLVLPNMASIPDIKVTHCDICGFIRLVNGNYKAKVALTHGPENVKPQVKDIDENGHFCFMVPIGEYRLSAIAASSEAIGLHFLPAYVDTSVLSPLLNIEFFQAQVDIHGTVLCKDKCSTSISVSLAGMLIDEKRVSSLGKDGEFVFANVLPGKYRLEVKREPSDVDLDDDWCWEQDSIIVDVGTEDKRGVTFVQKGYWMKIISTHDVDVDFIQPDGQSLRMSVKKGSEKICVETPGLHELHLVDSCIFFGNSTVKFDTLNPTPVHLQGEKYLIKGEIHIDHNLNQDEYILAENLLVDVRSRDNVDLNVITSHVCNEDDKAAPALYSYSMWANLGDELIFSPRDSRIDSKKKLLFYPRTESIKVTVDGCQASIPPFVGRQGLYIEGSVSPAIAGVDIQIISLGESRNALLQKGDVALETKTGEGGSFSGGPLYDDTSYRVMAFKSGYYLKPVGDNSFSCQKLSQIAVSIYAGGISELFPPVLLSLSGEDGYRNNSITAPGGSFVFEDLFSGNFYLRPLLKEYSFSPPAQAIELGSGEHKEVLFHASRVAYSATGVVSLLSGQPVEGILVEARSPSKGYYEESTTDATGNFRLRGLHPDTIYYLKVTVKEDPRATRIERASPESVAVKVGSEDIKGLDFVVFEQPETTILSSHVEGIDLAELQPHLTVQIKSASEPVRVISTFPLPLSSYFEVRDIPKGKHLLELVYSISSSTLKFKSEILEVDLAAQPQVHVGPLKYKLEELHQKPEVTPVPVFPLIIGVSVIALFVSMPRMKDLYNWAVDVAPSSSASNLKKDTKKPVIRKRAY